MAGPLSLPAAAQVTAASLPAAIPAVDVSTALNVPLAAPAATVPNLPAVVPTASVLSSLPVETPSAGIPSVGNTEAYSLISSMFNVILNLLQSVLGISNNLPLGEGSPESTALLVKEKRQLPASGLGGVAGAAGAVGAGTGAVGAATGLAGAAGAANGALGAATGLTAAAGGANGVLGAATGALSATSALAGVMAHATPAAQLGAATAALANLPVSAPTGVLNGVPGVSSVTSTVVGALDPLTCIVEAAIALFSAQFNLDPLSLISTPNLMTRDTEIHEFVKRQVNLPNLPTSALASVIPQATALAGNIPAIGGIAAINPTAALPFLSEILPLISSGLSVPTLVSSLESTLGPQLLPLIGSLPVIQYISAVLALLEMLPSINPSLSPLSALSNINSASSILALTSSLTPTQVSALNSLPIPNPESTDLFTSLLNMLNCINGISSFNLNIPLAAGVGYVFAKSISL